MYVHPTYAVTTEREPLGILDAWMWAREPKGRDGQRGGPKESLRWIEGYERLVELAPSLPATRLVYVADREADMMPLMARAQAGVKFLASRFSATGKPCFESVVTL